MKIKTKISVFLLATCLICGRAGAYSSIDQQLGGFGDFSDGSLSIESVGGGDIGWGGVFSLEEEETVHAAAEEELTSSGGGGGGSSQTVTEIVSDDSTGEESSGDSEEFSDDSSVDDSGIEDLEKTEETDQKEQENKIEVAQNEVADLESEEEERTEEPAVETNLSQNEVVPTKTTLVKVSENYRYSEIQSGFQEELMPSAEDISAVEDAHSSSESFRVLFLISSAFLLLWLVLFSFLFFVDYSLEMRK